MSVPLTKGSLQLGLWHVFTPKCKDLEDCEGFSVHRSFCGRWRTCSLKNNSTEIPKMNTCIHGSRHMSVKNTTDVRPCWLHSSYEMVLCYLLYVKSVKVPIIPTESFQPKTSTVNIERMIWRYYMKFIVFFKSFGILASHWANNTCLPLRAFLANVTHSPNCATLVWRVW